MATDTDMYATLQRRIAGLEKELERVQGPCNPPDACKENVACVAHSYELYGENLQDAAVLAWVLMIVNGEEVGDVALSFSLVSRVHDLRAERDEFRRGFAKAAATDIMSRGSAYQAGLDDAGYKACDTCGETCIPTCPTCEEGKWEKASQVYFDEGVELRERLKDAGERLKNAVTMLGYFHENSGRCLASLEKPCTVCAFIEAGKRETC